jgi:hypothetical protein
LQNYVFEPVEFLAKNLMCISVIVPLWAAGTLIVVTGVILLFATVVPLRAALLNTGASIFIVGGIIAYLLFSNTIILQTPTDMEMMMRGKARQVPEEDIIMTEELITRSSGRLKQSVVQAPSRALRCVGNTLKEHPIAAAGAAVGLG